MDLEEDLRKKRLRIAAVVGFAILLLMIGFISWRLTQDIAPTDTDAAVGNAIKLEVLQPKAKYLNGEKINVQVFADIKNTTGTLNVAEVVVNFDKARLRALSIRESNDLLGLNKTTNNTTGVATIDVAIVGGASFKSGDVLATIEFEVINDNAVSALVNVVNTSTLGVPNTLSSTTPSSFGSISIPLANATSSSTTTTTASSTSSATTSVVGQNRVNLTIDQTTKLFNVGERFKLKVIPNITVSQPASVTEIVITYDKNFLNAIAIIENSNYIGLNKTMDNTNGKLTVDVAATGGTNFVSGTILAEVEFEVKSTAASSTTIRISPESTFGIPNSLASSGLGNFNLLLAQPASTTSLTTASTASSSSVASQPSTSVESTTSETATSTSTTSSIPSTTTSIVASSSAPTTSQLDPYTPTGGDEILPGISTEVVVYGLFGLSAISGAGAGYLFFKQDPTDAF